MSRPRAPIPLLTAEEFLEEFRHRLRAAISLPDAVKTDELNPSIPDDRAATWTNALLNLILNWGHEKDFSTFPNEIIYNPNSGKNRRKGAEYLVDACWYTRMDEKVQWWKLSEGELQNHGAVLCVESEWGASPSSSSIFNDMMDDFSKLTIVTADLKAFIGTYVRQGTINGRPMCDEFLRVAESYATSHRWAYAGEQYLIMLWPYDASWQARNDFVPAIMRPRHDGRH